jgi:hypothetical protein
LSEEGPRVMRISAVQTKKEGHLVHSMSTKWDSRGREVVAFTTLVPKYDQDRLVFIEGLSGSQRVYAQLDGGSDVSCILKEHVVAMGLEHRMVPRPKAKQYQVRGIGQEAGTGQKWLHDVWLEIRVKGRKVDDWEMTDLAPVGGSAEDLLIEGWFAVLDEMTVPILVGGDLLHEHDVLPRPKQQVVVVQNKEDTETRVVVPMLTLATLIEAVGKLQDEVLRTPVWHEMARNSAAFDPDMKASFSVESAKVPPNSMRVVRVRYTRAVKEGEWFAVHLLVRTSLRVTDQGNQRTKLAYAVGWDPADGLV